MGFVAASKRLIKNGLTASGALRLARRFAASGAVILMYHSVIDEPDRHASTIGVGITHSTDAFRKQMEIVSRNYDPVTVEDVLSFLPRQKQLPPNLVAVTFDDGYLDNFEVALPLLKRLGIAASFYITVDCVETGAPPWVARLRYAFAKTSKARWSDPAGQAHSLTDPASKNSAFLAACEDCARMDGNARQQVIANIEHDLDTPPLTSQDCPMMTWDQIRRLKKDGHLVGSHTMTHPNMAYVDSHQRDFEFRESKRKLEQEMGAGVVHFAYPAPILEPHWTEQTVVASQEAGYRTAVTSTSGLVRGGDNALHLCRIPAKKQLDEFLWSLECTFLGRPT